MFKPNSNRIIGMRFCVFDGEYFGSFGGALG